MTDAPDTSPVGTEIASIEEKMRDSGSGYYRDEALQARYRALVDARDGGAYAVGKPATNRRAEIEAMIGDRHSDYYRKPALQAEYRRILDGGEADGGDDPATVAASIRSAYAPAATEGLSDVALSAARDAVRFAVEGVPDWAGVGGSFDVDVPDGAKREIFREFARPVTPDEARLSGRERLNARLLRLEDAMSPSDLDEVRGWIRRNKDAAAVIFENLARV